MRVLIIDESPERIAVLREGLEGAGYEVAAALASPLELLRAVETMKPDVIIIDTESPSRDVLEHVVLITRDQPRPIVMFASDDAPETIRKAVRAGVSAYIVDGLDPRASNRSSTSPWRASASINGCAPSSPRPISSCRNGSWSSAQRASS